MRRRASKLRLNRETLTSLGGEQMSKAVGGFSETCAALSSLVQLACFCPTYDPETVETDVSCAC